MEAALVAEAVPTIIVGAALILAVEVYGIAKDAYDNIPEKFVHQNEQINGWKDALDNYLRNGRNNTIFFPKNNANVHEIQTFVRCGWFDKNDGSYTQDNAHNKQINLFTYSAYKDSFNYGKLGNLNGIEYVYLRFDSSIFGHPVSSIINVSQMVTRLSEQPQSISHSDTVIQDFIRTNPSKSHGLIRHFMEHRLKVVLIPNFSASVSGENTLIPKNIIEHRIIHDVNLSVEPTFTPVSGGRKYKNKKISKCHKRKINKKTNRKKRQY